MIIALWYISGKINDSCTIDSDCVDAPMPNTACKSNKCACADGYYIDPVGTDSNPCKISKWSWNMTKL